MKFGSLITVRMNSQRLFGKCLKDVGGKPSLYWLCRQLSHSKYPFVVCTSDNSLDDAVEQFCIENDYFYFRGSEDDVLDRLIRAATKFDFDLIARITGDDLFVDPDILDKAVDSYCGAPFCYTDLPKGTDFQILDTDFLRQLQKTLSTKDTEYLTWYFNSCPDKKLLNVSPVSSLAYSFELDTPSDLEVVDFVTRNMNVDYFVLEDLLAFAEKNDHLFTKKMTVDDKVFIPEERD